MRFVKAFVLGAIVLAMLAATPNPGAAGAGPIIIKLGGVLPAIEPLNVAALAVADRVKNLTNGRVTIQVFCCAQLGNNRDILEQARMGGPVIGQIDPGYASEYGVKELAVLGGPFLFDNVDQIQRTIASPLVLNWDRELLQRGGLRVLAWNWYFGERHIISDRGYKEPQDLHGIKFRVPPNPAWVNTFRTLGAQPVTIEWAEVYTALGQGVIQAAEAPLSTLYGSKLYEVKKVITLTGHFKAITGLAIGERFFESLPKDVQEILVREFPRGGDLATKMVLQQQGEFKDKLAKAGVTFVQPDVPAYQRASRPFYAQFPGWPPDLYQQVRQAMGAR